jgi:[ribosomal protein S18]-alanine N-acetyltransferase
VSPVPRRAGRDDVLALTRLEADNLGADAWSAGLVEDGVTGGLPTVTWSVVEVEGEVVGYAVTSVAGDVAELQRIAVDPAHRRTGLATALVEHAATAARAEGADRLLLEVREDNGGALAFYADRGFVEVDRRRRYYRDGATAVVLRRPLTTGCG